MMNACQHDQCNNLVDIDPWCAYPNEYADVPYLCNEHIKPFEATIRARFALRRERKKRDEVIK